MMIDEQLEAVLLALSWVCLAAWRALPLFLVGWFVHLTMNKRLHARYSCVLWLLVIARLLLPVSVSSPVGISASADSGVKILTDWVEGTPSSKPEFETYTYSDKNGNSVTVPILSPDATPEERQRAEAFASRYVQSPEAANTNSQGVRYSTRDREPASNFEAVLSVTTEVISLVAFVLLFVWPVGFAYLACRGAVSYLRFALKLRGQATITEQSVIDRLLRACDDVHVGRRPVLKQVDILDSPAVFGFWRPVICLPTKWQEQLRGDEFDWVLRHELAHIKRHDGLKLLVASIARCIHWFHPISWVAVSKLRVSIEQAADDTATKGMTDSNLVRYGEVLLRYAELGMLQRQASVVGLLAMASSSDLSHRIDALRVGPNRRTWLLNVCMVPLIACIAGAGLTDTHISVPKPKERQRVPDFKLVSDQSSWPNHLSNTASIESSEPAIEIEVNVEKAIRKAKELQPEVDAELFIKTYFAHPHRDTATIENGVLRTKATKSQEVFIKESLAAFERVGLWQVTVECRFLEADTRLLSDMEWDWNEVDDQTSVTRIDTEPTWNDPMSWQGVPSIDVKSPFRESHFLGSKPDKAIPIRATRVSDHDFAIFLRRCQTDARSNILQAPKVTLFNRQFACVADVAAHPFVTDVTVVEGNLAHALEPKISVFESGRKIWLKPQVTEQGEVDLQCVFRESEISEVRLATLPFVLPGHPDADVTIQIPTVRSESISVQTCLSDDEVLLVFSPLPYAEENDSNRSMGRVLAIRTTPIADESLFTASDTQ